MLLFALLLFIWVHPPLESLTLVSAGERGIMRHDAVIFCIG